MAPLTRARSKSMRPIIEERRAARTLLSLRKAVPVSVKKKEEPEERLSTKKVLSDLPEARNVLHAARKAARPVKRVVLKMWNGSRIALYPAEYLALRYNGKVYRHKMKKARCEKLADVSVKLEG